MHFMNLWLEPRYLDWLAHGFVITLVLSACVSVCATLLGFGLAVAQISQHRTVAAAARLYVLVFRNSPLLAQLLFWYFGAATLLPQLWMTWLNAPHLLNVGPIVLRWPSFELFAGWLGLTCYSTAFIAEEFRAGIRGVGVAQYQAGAALGMTRYATLRHVILPQAVRIATPPLAGQYMNIVKNSSLTMAIGVAELSYMSRQVDTESFRTFQAFGTATVLYVVTIALIEIALVIWQRTGARALQRGHA
ncbi:amino acid ABC transporter permease [Paraburkholderia phytofirmans]|jgi:polar amino acid transport system permease protein|uniref:amino acid ABC transporter permease n=1 Tax=Paraburkholderia sp. BL9I2N2 TaxID=1938809 RepID=UPI0010EA42AA|nr:amino acid ABC transporter permease [Paraburkholderia sp. BL9I2N2]TCK95306.1 amino acid ABC transporter membrane protein 1 (PAAT family) [Paraburkholderia sp. BL9I2N2]